MPEVFASHPFLSYGGDLDRSHGARSSPRGSISTPTARIRSTASAARSAMAARAREPTSRSPRTPRPTCEEEEHWKKTHGWQEIHHWDYPMLPQRFVESSCVKCHHQVTDIPQAKKLQAGYQRIVQYGCTGCHTIGGEGSFGPDLTDERTVGPNLSHVGSKVSREWVVKWIKNPHAFRPDSRMPRFYGADQQRRQGRPAQERRRDPGDHPLPVRQEHAPRRVRRSPGQDRPQAGQGALPPEGLPGLPPAPAL